VPSQHGRGALVTAWGQRDACCVSRGAVIRKPHRRMRWAAGRVFSKELGRQSAGRVLAQADAAYPLVAERIPKTRAGARDLLRTGAYAIALSRALFGYGVEPAKANGLIADAVFASIIPARTALYRIGGLRYRSQMDRAKWGSEVVRRLYYTPPDWVMNDVEVDDGFGFDVTRCVVAEFFHSLGMSDLCNQVICDQDVRTATHHGVVLERTQTLAAGGSHCDFRYRSMTDRPRTQESVRGRMGAGERSGARWGTTPLEDSIEVDAAPETVWAWLSTMADHYTEWHPDHISAGWIRGEPNHVGSRLEAIEYLAGHREKLVFEMTGVTPPRRMEYRILGPHSILLPAGRFVVSELDHRSVFQAEIDVRFARLAAIAFRRRIEALRIHMHEEGRSLKRLIEASLEPTD